MAPTVVQTICIIVAGEVYKVIATKIVNLENHREKQEYEISLT